MLCDYLKKVVPIVTCQSKVALKLRFWIYNLLSWDMPIFADEFGELVELQIIHNMPLPDKNLNLPLPLPQLTYLY